MNATDFKCLKLWKHPDSYFGATWYDYYSVAGQHRDSCTLTRSNWQSWLKWIEKLIGPESDETWVTSSANHWAVGWVETLYVHKDVAPDLLQKIDLQLCALEDYPVFDEEHFSNLEQNEYWECWSRHGCGRDFAHELKRSFEKAERPLSDRLIDRLESATPDQLCTFHESLISSGEYFHSDNSGLYPNLDMSADNCTADDLAKFIRRLRNHSTTP